MKMGRFVVKQPNGRFAVFSTIVDDFVCMNADEEEIKSFLTAEARLDAEQAAERAVEKAKARGPDDECGWNECISLCGSNNGKRKARARIQAGSLSEAELTREESSEW